MKAFINGRKLFGTPFYPLIGREAVSLCYLEFSFFSCFLIEFHCHWGFYRWQSERVQNLRCRFPHPKNTEKTGPKYCGSCPDSAVTGAHRAGLQRCFPLLTWLYLSHTVVWVHSAIACFLLVRRPEEVSVLEEKTFKRGKKNWSE